MNVFTWICLSSAALGHCGEMTPSWYKKHSSQPISGFHGHWIRVAGSGIMLHSGAVTGMS